MTAGAGTPRPSLGFRLWVMLLVAGSAVSVFSTLLEGPGQRFFDLGTAEPAPLGWAGYAVRLAQVPLLLWVAWAGLHPTNHSRIELLLGPIFMLWGLKDLSGTVSDLAAGRPLDGYDTFIVLLFLAFVLLSVYLFRRPTLPAE